MQPSENRTAGGPALATRALERLTLVLGVLVVVLFGWVVVARFRYPIDAEWMTGAMRDAVERVRAGAPLYARPSATFIPFVYPPLWYWLSALVAHFLPTAVACRLVSLLATAACACGIACGSRHLGARWFWTVTAVFLHFAAYAITLTFYDLERVDVLEAALVISGLVALVSPRLRPTVSAGLGGALLALSFFAKQPGLFAFGGAIAALVWSGERKRALTALVAGSLVLLAMGGVLEITTGGWFRYYCIYLPGSHGVEPALLTKFFLDDVPRTFLLFGASIAVIAGALRRGRTGDWRHALFAGVLGAGLVGAYFLRAHRGGWVNVIITWTPLACIAVSVVATPLEALGETAKRMILGAAALQLVAGMYDPNDVAPNDVDLHEAKAFEALVRKLETQGDVLVTASGNVTRQPHFHCAALYDVLRAGDRAPDDYLDGIRKRSYAALVLSSLDEYDCRGPTCREVHDAVLRNYFIAAHLPAHVHTGVVGYEGAPRWILRPRQAPLPDATDDELRRRERSEAAQATMRQLAVPPNVLPTPDDAIEGLAAQSVPALGSAIPCPGR